MRKKVWTNNRLFRLVNILLSNNTMDLTGLPHFENRQTYNHELVHL